MGWQAGRGIHGQLVLDVLFVKLDRPAKTVKIDGLLEKVVHITRDSKNVECTFSSDLKEYLHRSQVWVLPNFSMTNYTLQGKTRPKNSVDLSNCRSYTTPVCQEVQLQVELSLCSHFPLDSSHVELQVI